MHHHTHHAHHGHHRRSPLEKPQVIVAGVLVIIWKLFVAGSISCFLVAAHRVAHGALLAGRAKALHVLGESLAPEEKELLVEKIKAGAICCR